MQSIESAIDEFAASESGESLSHRPVSPIECFADAAAVDALETNENDTLIDSSSHHPIHQLKSSMGASGHSSTSFSNPSSPALHQNASEQPSSPVPADQAPDQCHQHSGSNSNSHESASLPASAHASGDLNPDHLDLLTTSNNRLAIKPDPDPDPDLPTVPPDPNNIHNRSTPTLHHAQPLASSSPALSSNCSSSRSPRHHSSSDEMISPLEYHQSPTGAGPLAYSSSTSTPTGSSNPSSFSSAAAAAAAAAVAAANQSLVSSNGCASLFSPNTLLGATHHQQAVVALVGGNGSGGGGNQSHHQQPTNQLLLYGNDAPDTKEGMDELCPVCGDKVSGYHYGLLTCESCKGFFKRTVQNKKVYTCVAERQCHIDKSQRKRCPYCRFQKCLDVGMKLEAVRADRMRGGRNKFGPMYKRDRARRMQMLRQRQQHIMLNSSLNTSQNSNSSTTTGGSHAMTTNTQSTSTSSSGTNNNSLGGNSATGLGSLSLDHHHHHHHHHSLHTQQHLHSTPPHSQNQFSLINSGLTLYSPDGIKQELIQIPHLSSSTSSPDSSPSPLNSQITLNGVGAHHINQPTNHSLASAHPHHQLTTPTNNANNNNSGNNNNNNNNNVPGFGALELDSVAASHPELVKWVNSATTAAPTPLSSGPLHHSSSNSSVPTLSAPNPAVSVNNNPIASGSNSNSLNNNHHQQSIKSNQATFGFTSTATTDASASTSFVNSAAGSTIKLPYVIRELQMSAPDDKEWQAQLFGLLNSQTYNQCEVDLFELMCKVIDQSLFAQVDWARNSIFFKDLKVDDQMKLLQHAWSDLLVLDHIHQRLQHGLQDEASLPNGQKFDLVGLALLGVPSALPGLLSLQNKLAELKFDSVDYLCLKFLLLLNPDVRGLSNYKLVQEAFEQTQQSLLQYCTQYYPQVSDKFGQLMAQLPQLRHLTVRGEEFLYYKHLNGNAPTQTLLMEMLHAKRK